MARSEAYRAELHRLVERIAALSVELDLLRAQLIEGGAIGAHDVPTGKNALEELSRMAMRCEYELMELIAKLHAELTSRPPKRERF